MEHTDVRKDGRLIRQRRDRLEPHGNLKWREMQDGRGMWIKNVDAMDKCQTPLSHMAGEGSMILILTILIEIFPYFKMYLRTF